MSRLRSPFGFSSGSPTWASDAIEQDIRDFAMQAWMETVAIEQALDEHTCDGEKGTMYQAREYVFIIRMLISGGYRHYIPSPRSGVDFSQIDREKAMQWLVHQNNVAMQLQAVMASKDVNSLARRLLLKRPYLVWWQMSQLGRALRLWDLDRSMTYAVDVALSIYPVLRWFETMWPCPEQRKRGVVLRSLLQRACAFLGKQMT